MGHFETADRACVARMCQFPNRLLYDHYNDNGPSFLPPHCHPERSEGSAFVFEASRCITSESATILPRLHQSSEFGRIAASHSAILDAGETPVNKWWGVSWKRVGIALLLVFGSLWLVYGAAVLISYQLRPWLTARSLAKEFPELDRVPVALADKSLSPLAGIRVEVNGLSLQTPWKDVAEKRATQRPSFVFFSDGAGIMALDPAQDMDRYLLVLFRNNHVLDEQTLRSSYALRATSMAATSEQVKWWRLPRQNLKYLLPFTLKATALQGPGALYSISSGQFHGFQIGNPSVAPYEVNLDLYDGADRHYRIRFFERGAPRPFLTQGEINAMMASLRPAPGK